MFQRVDFKRMGYMGGFQRALTILWAVGVLAGWACAQEPALTAEQEMELKLLSGQLADPARSASTKIEAAELLLTRSYPQSRQVLAGFLSDAANRPAQIAVAEAVARRKGGPAAFIDPLIGMLTGPEPSVRAPAVRALVTYKNNGVGARLVAVALDAKQDRQVRLVTIAALHRLLDKRTVDALVRLLDEPDAAVRDAAMATLTKLTNIRAFGSDPAQWKQWWERNKDRDRTDWLADLAESLARVNTTLEADNARLRERLVLAMGQLYAATPPQQQDALLLSFLKDQLAEARLVGAQLIERKITAGNAKVPEAIREQFRGMLADADPRLRQAAAKFIANTGYAKALGALLERLKVEETPVVRQAICQALGQLRDPAAMPGVLAEVNSKYDAVAASAAGALARIAAKHPLEGDERRRAVKVMVERYARADKTNGGMALREALLSGMGVVADEAFVPVLQGALQDSAATVRLAAVNSLAQLDHTESAALLAALTSDGDRGVRRAAIVALKTLDGQTHLQTLLQRTDPAAESDADVREQAWEAVIDILSDANADVLAQVAGALAERGDAVAQRIKIMQMWVDVLKARKSEKLPAIQRQLADALMRANRPAEAAGNLAAAYAQLAGAKDPQASAVWVEWINSLLAAEDPGALKIMADNADDAAFAAALDRLSKQLKQMHTAGRFLAVIALAQEALTQLPQRLTVAQREAVEQMLAEATRQQDRNDQQRVMALAPQLLGADESARKAAATELESMGDRAVRPLLAELKKVINADKPNAQLEAAIVDVLKRLAKDINGYDPAAPREQRLALLDKWGKSTTQPSQ